MNDNLMIFGAGGHCQSVLDVLLKNVSSQQVIIVGRKVELGKKILGIPIEQTDQDLDQLLANGHKSAFIAIGDNFVRETLFNALKKRKLLLPNIIADTADVTNFAKLTQGIFVGKQAVINVGVTIGQATIINTGAIVEHDCQIDDFVHIAPKATLCGQVKIGKRTLIGAGTVIKLGIIVGANSIVGAGSVVVQDIPDHVVAYGNPCRVIREL